MISHRRFSFLKREFLIGLFTKNQKFESYLNQINQEIITKELSKYANIINQEQNHSFGNLNINLEQSLLSSNSNENNNKIGNIEYFNKIIAKYNLEKATNVSEGSNDPNIIGNFLYFRKNYCNLLSKHGIIE